MRFVKNLQSMVCENQRVGGGKESKSGSEGTQAAQRTSCALDSFLVESTKPESEMKKRGVAWLQQ